MVTILAMAIKSTGCEHRLSPPLLSLGNYN